MHSCDTNQLLTHFYDAISNEAGVQAPWAAFRTLTENLVGTKLLTFMEVDMVEGVAHRSYTSDAQSYPVSGSKPITRDDWFKIVHEENRLFVANTIQDIALVFPDHEFIWSLGCGSVINLPVRLGGELVGTFNLLDVEHHYTPERVKLVQNVLQRPSQMTYLATKTTR